MIVTRLMGGLGNQMFQYAAARALALRHGVELRVDLSYLEHQHPATTQRAYALGCFRLDAAFATEDDLRWARYGEPQDLRARLRDVVKTLLRPHRLHVVQQGGAGFDPRLLEAGPNSLLVGYWQSEDYFRDAGAAVRADLSFRGEPDDETRRLAEAIEAANTVSVHVRRGDYVLDPRTSAFHGTLTPEWYAAAAAEVAARVEAPAFFVFSDDLDWCRRHLRLPHPTTFVERQQPAPDHEDLRLMALCRHHVVANSSFSWWGAWLDPRPDKVVVVPTAWFADPSVDTSRVPARGWIRL